MIKKLFVSLSAFLTSACTTSSSHPPLDKVASVDMQRYMGDWYVIANIPTFIEKGAHNALEHYELSSDGSVAIRFTFNKDSIDGPKKEYTMTGTVVEGTNNAEWKVSPFWPLKFPYYVVELAEDYSWVVVGMPERQNLWIMARQKTLPETVLKDLIERSVQRGFDRAQILMVPQKLP